MHGTYYRRAKLMPGDHMFGLAPLIAGMLNGLGGSTNDTRVEESTSSTPLEIYGPKNLRGLLRTVLLGTYTNLLGRYVVYELHCPGETAPSYETKALHPNEVPGRNIQQTNPGLWENFIFEDDITVSAGEIAHSVPSLGFVVQEQPLPGKLTPDLVMRYTERIKTHNLPRSTLSLIQKGQTITLPTDEQLHPPPSRPGRKIAILGDTSNPSNLIHLCQNANVVIHEATNAYIPELDVGMSYASVQERTISRGHSTPQMAGKFATACFAKVLLLNHFSARYADEGEPIIGKNGLLKEGHETGVMTEIRDLAKSEFMGTVVCARDLWSWEITDNA
jgi:ribonuclease Z